MLYYIILYYIILYYIILYYIILYYIILYYIVLYCIVLYYIIVLYSVLLYLQSQWVSGAVISSMNQKVGRSSVTAVTKRIVGTTRCAVTAAMDRYPQMMIPMPVH